MDDIAADTPLESFQKKWAASRPEFGLALTFVGDRDRAAQSAFACLRFELEYTAFGIREMQPAATKLQWWMEEFARAGRHEARHPLTQALSLHADIGSIPLDSWHAAIAGAFAQRDAPPAADSGSLLDGYASLFRPLAAIEATLFAPLDAVAIGRAAVLARALRETATLPDALRDGRLPLPLDVLARQHLSRGDLVQTSAAQAAALRDWLLLLSAEATDILRVRSHLGAVHAASASADGWRARKAAAADYPLQALRDLSARLPLRTAWVAWRQAVAPSADKAIAH